MLNKWNIFTYDLSQRRSFSTLNSVNNYPQKGSKTSNLDIRNYLLGGNENLIGTCISIRKSLKMSNLDKYFIDERNDPNTKHYVQEGFAILLYFDHRLGRIVRHLFNPNLVFRNKKPNVDVVEHGTISPNRILEEYEIDMHSNNEKLVYKLLPSNPYLYNYKQSLHRVKPTLEVRANDMKHYPKEITMATKYLCDGKITRHMFNLFMSELIRDYIFTNNVYNHTDISLIREGTRSSQFIKTNSTQIPDPDHTRLARKGYAWGKGEGYGGDAKMIGIKPVLDYPTDLKLIGCGLKPIIDYPKNDVKEIYIPKGISTKDLTTDYKLTPKLIGDSPQVIKDLKSIINAKTILNNKYLINKINYFNRALEQKLKLMVE